MNSKIGLIYYKIPRMQMVIEKSSYFAGEVNNYIFILLTHRLFEDA